jgi:hypothetical protein
MKTPAPVITISGPVFQFLEGKGISVNFTRFCGKPAKAGRLGSLQTAVRDPPAKAPC